MWKFVCSHTSNCGMSSQYYLFCVSCLGNAQAGTWPEADATLFTEFN